MTDQNYYVREFKKDQKVQVIYKIKEVPYRQHISYSAFLSYKHKRNYVDGMNHFFINKSADDFEFEDEMAANTAKLCGKTYVPRERKIIECKDVYDFYDKIGYNRHKKRFERQDIEFYVSMDLVTKT